ncbi:hypothetical protein CIB84_016865 [Bambusicola thoracicus]|uniref:Uncharacterized protein n=1 Tax=Bambusicola thoracicus TaxID=9083 RepID=A0A2P4S5K9_BAMTH|nr:hypothetical protein CIB84_016865 [Bambusicola thoracicus]
MCYTGCCFWREVLVRLLVCLEESI